MRLDDIVMAPFCSHDCFHLHWRWSTVSDAEWTKGWSATKPYASPGAPMIPVNHDLDLTMWGPGELSLTEVAAPTANPAEDDTHNIPAHRWEIFCYQGAAYAQAVTSYFMLEATLGRVKASAVRFVAGVADDAIRSGGTAVPVDNKPSLYWNLRYTLENRRTDPEAVEWIQMSPAQLDKARKG